MKKIGIFYASSAGHTATVARKIAAALGVPDEDVHNVADTAPSALGDYELCIMGSPTYASGEMQHNMEDFVDGASALDLKGHRLAFFGPGDENMNLSFCSAVGDMAEAMTPTGAEQVGQFDAKGYVFDASEAEIAPGVYAGLMLDDANHPELTDARIDAWTALLKK